VNRWCISIPGLLDL